MENKLSERDKKGRPVWRIEVLLAEPGERVQSGGGMFGDWRSLAGMAGVTVK